MEERLVDVRLISDLKRILSVEDQERWIVFSRSRKTRYCKFCGAANHTIDRCLEFHELPVNDRWMEAKSLRLCFSCLQDASHQMFDCPEAVVCGIEGCFRKHNPLLHLPSNIQSKVENGRNDSAAWRPYDLNPITSRSPTPPSSLSIGSVTNKSRQTEVNDLTKEKGFSSGAQSATGKTR
jgi:hypothetical protein